MGINAKKYYEYKKERGFTLLEVMVALMSSSILVMGLYQMFQSQHNTYFAQGDRIEIQQNLRSGIHLLTKDLRSVRYNPKGIINTDCLNFKENLDNDNIFIDMEKGDIDYKNDTNRIAFVIDKNSNGIIELQNDGMEYGAIRPQGAGPIEPEIIYEKGERGEFIAYRHHANELQRFNSEIYAETTNVVQSWQTVATNVDALNFVYIDDFGDRTGDPGIAKSIQVALLIRSSKKDLDYTDTTNYKNHQGDEICSSCMYDHYHRRLIRMTIRLRNRSLESCTS